MIFAKNGQVNVDGNEMEVLQDWCILTDAIFKNMFNEEYENKLRETVEFIIQESEELDDMKK